MENQYIINHKLSNLMPLCDLKKKGGTWNQLVDNQSKVFKFNIKHVTLKTMVTWIQLMSHINFIIMKLITT